MSEPKQRAPKKPQDRKPKAEPGRKFKTKRTEFDLNGRTVTGWEVTEGDLTIHVADESIDDDELMEDLVAVDQGKPQMASQALRRIVGDDQHQMVREHLRSPESGRVSFKEITAWMYELIRALNPNG